MLSPEHEFVSRFLTLATLSDPVIAADYKKPLQQVTSLGVALPPLKYKYDPRRARDSASRGGNDAKNKEFTITLKSVRPPKFSLDCKFSSNVTVYQIKQKLLTEKKAETTEQLKLLLKGKVLHDSELLSDLISDSATINVMISKVDPSASTHLTSESSPEAPDIQIPWREIENTLRSSLKDPADVSEALRKLKQGWELAK